MQAPPLSPTLPDTPQLLVAGGDARLALDPESGTNIYACPPFPDPELAAFGSSTASVISTAGFAAADALRKGLLHNAATQTLDLAGADEFGRIRRELLDLCDLSDLPRLQSIFAASGTDLHHLAGQLVGGTEHTPTLAIMVESRETGSGVTTSLNACGNIEIASVSIRHDDGTPRPSADVDAEVETLVVKASEQARRILLIPVDVSKTGLIAPSPACVMKLHRQFPQLLSVFVDACQFRIANATLRAYLEQGFMVGLTGSKFIGGPSFSGLLLVPSGASPRLHGNPPLSSEHSDFGLLLRWEAALAELRAFRTVPENEISHFLQAFSLAIRNRLTNDPAFEILPTAPLERRPLTQNTGWDHFQTIFPFLLYRPNVQTGRVPLNREETTKVSHRLRLDLSGEDNSSSTKTSALRCQLGQPVACGIRNGVPVSALRLCLSTRLIVEASTRNGAAAVIARAMAVLDKTAQLSTNP